MDPKVCKRSKKSPSIVMGGTHAFIGLGREVLEGEESAFLLDGRVNFVDELHLFEMTMTGKSTT